MKRIRIQYRMARACDGFPLRDLLTDSCYTVINVTDQLTEKLICHTSYSLCITHPDVLCFALFLDILVRISGYEYYVLESVSIIGSLDDSIHCASSMYPFDEMIV